MCVNKSMPLWCIDLYLKRAKFTNSWAVLEAFYHANSHFVPENTIFSAELHISRSRLNKIDQTCDSSPLQSTFPLWINQRQASWSYPHWITRWCNCSSGLVLPTIVIEYLREYLAAVRILISFLCFLSDRPANIIHMLHFYRRFPLAEMKIIAKLLFSFKNMLLCSLPLLCPPFDLHSIPSNRGCPSRGLSAMRKHGG